MAKKEKAGIRCSISGENIMMGNFPEKTEFVLARRILAGWIESEGHRENILHKGFTMIGVGGAFGLDGETYYFTQVFTSKISSSLFSRLIRRFKRG